MSNINFNKPDVAISSSEMFASNESLVKREERPIFVTTKKPVIDKLGRAYGTGRRKVAVARAWIKPGTGKIIVNGQDEMAYFKRKTLTIEINKPFDKTENLKKFDVYCTVAGGGISGQAGAVRHAIARALDNFNPSVYHNILKANKFLTRDDRMVESKKYGRHGARRGTQFSKR